MTESGELVDRRVASAEIELDTFGWRGSLEAIATAAPSAVTAVRVGNRLDDGQADTGAGVAVNVVVPLLGRP